MGLLEEWRNTLILYSYCVNSSGPRLRSLYFSDSTDIKCYHCHLFLIVCSEKTSDFFSSAVIPRTTLKKYRSINFCLDNLHNILWNNLDSTCVLSGLQLGFHSAMKHENGVSNKNYGWLSPSCENVQFYEWNWSTHMHFVYRLSLCYDEK